MAFGIIRGEKLEKMRRMFWQCFFSRATIFFGILTSTFYIVRWALPPLFEHGAGHRGLVQAAL